MFCGYTSRCFVAKIWTLFLFHTHTQKPKNTHVLRIYTFKPALKKSKNGKEPPKKKKKKKRINAERKGSKVDPLGLGLGLFGFWSG